MFVRIGDDIYNLALLWNVQIDKTPTTLVCYLYFTGQANDGFGAKLDGEEAERFLNALERWEQVKMFAA